MFFEMVHSNPGVDLGLEMDIISGIHPSDLRIGGEIRGMVVIT